MHQRGHQGEGSHSKRSAPVNCQPQIKSAAIANSHYADDKLPRRPLTLSDGRLCCSRATTRANRIIVRSIVRRSHDQTSSLWAYKRILRYNYVLLCYYWQKSRQLVIHKTPNDRESGAEE